MSISPGHTASSLTRKGRVTEPVAVDVLMIAYNVEAFIGHAVDGVLAQVAGFPIRLVIAEDASTDGTPGICEKLAAAHPEVIHYVSGKKNLKIAERTVEGLRHCQAKYVAICDSDDHWNDPHKLAAQVDFLESHPDHGLSYTDIRIMTRGGVIIEEDDHLISRSDYGQGEVFAKLLQGNFVNNSTTVVRRELLEQLEPNACCDNLIGDYIRWLQIAMRAKVHFLPRKSMDYRQGGITSAVDLQKRTGPSFQGAMGRLLVENDRFKRALPSADKAILFRKTLGALKRRSTPASLRASLLFLLFKYIPGLLAYRLGRS